VRSLSLPVGSPQLGVDLQSTGLGFVESRGVKRAPARRIVPLRMTRNTLLYQTNLRLQRKQGPEKITVLFPRKEPGRGLGSEGQESDAPVLGRRGSREEISRKLVKDRWTIPKPST
jgi:hypothetical protein